MCLLSYTKTCDNKVVQKYPLPRVLIHGQSEIDEADDRCFFVDAINKSVYDAMLNHNTTFLNTFHNTMKKVFHGYPIDQIGPAYYNIPHPSTQVKGLVWFWLIDETLSANLVYQSGHVKGSNNA